MGKRIEIAQSAWQPPANSERMLLERLKLNYETLLADKMQMIVVLLAVVKSQGGEVSFPTATLKEVNDKDKLHYRIENEVTTLSYEAAEADSLPAPPTSRIILPGSREAGGA